MNQTSMQNPLSGTHHKQTIRTVVIFLVIMAVSVPGFYFGARAYVISLAEKDIKDLLLAQKGIHEYVQQIMHPALYGYQEKGEIPKSFYAPELFSSTFFVRNQYILYNNERELAGMPKLYYKMAAINPRNPVNTADQLEAELIRKFNTDRTLKSYREIIKTKNGSFLYVALPFLPNTQACLKCHGKREDAPVQLQSRYPGQGGFNEKVGDLRAIISIRAPLAHEFATILVIVSSMIMGLLVFIALFFFNSRLRHLVTVKTLSLEEKIIERKKAETALAKEKELLAVTLASIADGVITTDLHGRIAMMNSVASELTGWSNEEAMGRPLDDVYRAVNVITRKKNENPVSALLTDGEKNHTILIARDGRERSVSTIGSPIKNNAGDVVGIVLILRDITDQLRIDQELAKIKKLESVGVLAGGIAHDFNNILSAIIGNIDLSLLNTDIESESRVLLMEAQKASLRAQTLTRQLLTFARGGEPVKETASLTDVIMESANFILRGGKVLCSYSFPDDLYLADIDKGQFSQVIQNIILNASQAMSGGGVIKISCQNIPPDKSSALLLPGTCPYVKIDIKDTGVGIPAHMIDRIFDPYFSTKQQGSGLGLAISHSIIIKHGGQIRVTSEPGVGTTFTIFLPASTSTSLPETIHEISQGPGLSIKSKILVMDDEEQIQKMSQRMIEKMGHTVLIAKDGEEAVRIYRDEMSKGSPIDLVIMDLTVPGGMGGKDAAKEVLSMNPDAKIIVSSGYSTDPVMSSYREFGFCKAIVKPFQLGDFRKTVDEVLNG